MNIEMLADVLKRRGCRSVCYFHADHFEPWSTRIDQDSARAIERMAAQARVSAYARRLSLFYNVFVPYRLAAGGSEATESCVPGDGVAFAQRSPRQEAMARDAIRPLVHDGHEIHLHVHHEFWTQNSSHFDTPVSRWVNEHSNAHADAARLDLHFQLCKDAIAREIGMPFERWAFVHGNWALNASDPSICRITGEMAMIAKHGGYGDFSFPAGRAHCDPKIEAPFTCLPLDHVRAYDDPRADPRAIELDSKVMRPERFFIWNSPIKASHTSLDYYSAANRKLFQNPERVLGAWLGTSVCLGDTLFIKTHAHSMKGEYRLAEPDSLIPHGYPAIVAIFDGLSRVCERADVELRLLTVNEVYDLVAAFDGSPRRATAAEGTAMMSTPTMAVSDSKAIEPDAVEPDAVAPLPPTEPAAILHELLDLHRAWLAREPATTAPDDLYQVKLARGAPLEPYEHALAAEIADRYPPDSTRIIEIGTGWGGLGVLLARLGYEVFGFEGNARRHAACSWHFDEQIRRFPILGKRLRLAPLGLFPEAMSADALAVDKINVGVATNITSSYTAEHEQEIAQTAVAFDELILDLARFGHTRNEQEERDALRRVVIDVGFKPVERMFFDPPYEYWRFRSRSILGAGRIALAPPAAPDTDGFSPAPPALLPAMPRALVKTQRAPLFGIAGEKTLTECPVCHARDIGPIWRIPMTAVKTPINVFGGYFDQIPTLQVPGTLFCFDLCAECESIFLNPVPALQKEGYRRTDHYIRKMENAEEWRGYEQVYDRFARWIPRDATVMLDAACGIGQYLEIARRRSTHRWQRLIGLELGDRYVEHMRTRDLEAHPFDIDTDDLLAIVPAASVDFISFCEGFEHVERPLDALGKLLSVLRPGGRLFFTAQRYGPDAQAAIRPGEPIYIGEKVVEELPRRLGCRVLNKASSGTRYYLVLAK